MRALALVLCSGCVVGYRVGPAVGVAFTDHGDLGHTGVTLGGRFALLPTVREHVGQGRYDKSNVTSLHVGLAASGDYEWNDHRGLFLIGPTVESYAELSGP